MSVLNVVLPLGSSVLSFAFAAMVLDQWWQRRHSFQLVWGIGLLFYGISAGTEFIGSAFGWSEPLYRTWYLIGAFFVAAYLGAGTIYLLSKSRFGYFAAATVSFAIGTLLLGAIVVLSGKAGGIGSVAHVQWYYLLGGALGAAYVFSALVLVSQIGAGAVAAAPGTGQLTTSVILDRIGFLGLEQTSFSASRVAGVALLLAGTYLVVR